MTWYAITTEPQREKLVRRLLKQRGHVAYLPAKVIRTHRRRSGKNKRRIVLLMPGYVLVQATGYPASDALLLHSARSVRHVRRHGEVVLGPISDAKVEILRHIIKDEVAFDAVRRTPKRLKIGGEARIKVGPYAGTTAKVSFLRGGNARLLLWLMGSEREVTARIENVEAA